MTNSQYLKCQEDRFQILCIVRNFLDVCQLKPQNGCFSLMENFLCKPGNQQYKRSYVVSW